MSGIVWNSFWQNLRPNGAILGGKTAVRSFRKHSIFAKHESLFVVHGRSFTLKKASIYCLKNLVLRVGWGVGGWLGGLGGGWAGFGGCLQGCIQGCTGLYRGVYKGLHRGVYRSVYRGVYKGVERGLFRGIYKGIYKGACRGVCRGVKLVKIHEN